MPAIESSAGWSREMSVGRRSDVLPDACSVLAVCAHPDDESFGLGAVLDRFAQQGARISVLCFTRGEASTLGVTAEDLGELRHRELTAASAALGVSHTELLEHRDGHLADVPLGELAGAVEGAARAVGAELLLVFDEGGVTGHTDHQRATEAGLASASDLPVLAWTLPASVAAALSVESGVAFVGRGDDEVDLNIPVVRDRQHRAIACHASQSTDNQVLRRRLELLGDHEVLRWLRRPAQHPADQRTSSDVDTPVVDVTAWSNRAIERRAPPDPPTD